MADEKEKKTTTADLTAPTLFRSDSLYAVIYHVTAGILFWDRSLDQQ